MQAFTTENTPLLNIYYFPNQSIFTRRKKIIINNELYLLKITDNFKTDTSSMISSYGSNPSVSTKKMVFQLVISSSIIIIAIFLIILSSSIIMQSNKPLKEQISFIEFLSTLIGVGNYAYVSNNYGVDIIDVGELQRSTNVMTLKSPDGAFGLSIKGELLYIASDSDGFEIANISNPQNAVVIGVFNDGGSIYDVYVEEPYAYTIEFSSGIEILNITNPQSITKIGTYNDGGDFRDLIINQGILYLADATNGLKVLNITNPSSPTKLITVPNTQRVIRLSLHEDLLFLANHGNGIKILNISNPLIPEVIGVYSKAGGEAYGVAGNSSILYVADLQLGVYSLDISTPSRPLEIDQYSNAVPHNVFFDGKYVYLADQDHELIILDQGLRLMFSGYSLNTFEEIFRQLFPTLHLFLECFLWFD